MSYFHAIFTRIFKNYICSPRAIINKGASIGKGCYIGNVLASNKVVIGDYSYINGGIVDNITIGKYCSMAHNLCLAPAEHNYELPSNYTKGLFPERKTERAYVGNDVWIGNGVFIKEGINIGDGAVIGANSVVTHNIEPFSINFGNPCRKYKSRFSKEITEKLIDLRWWDLEYKELKKIVNSMNDIYDIEEFRANVKKYKKVVHI